MVNMKQDSGQDSSLNNPFLPHFNATASQENLASALGSGRELPDVWVRRLLEDGCIISLSSPEQRHKQHSKRRGAKRASERARERDRKARTQQKTTSVCGHASSESQRRCIIKCEQITAGTSESDLRHAWTDAFLA